MELTYPLALLSGLAIVLPILIHLWHKKAKKVLVVGSIRHLQEGKQQQLRKWYVKDWPLLLLRCALLLCLSLVLAEPMLALRSPEKQAKGWVLLGNGFDKGLDAQQQETVDSLLQQGFALRAFAPGFAKIGDRQRDTVAPASDYFDLVSRLDQQLPDGYPVVLFTASHLHHFSGEPPSVGLRVVWNTFAHHPDSSVRWVERAWETEEDSIRLLVARSDTGSTVFSGMTLAEDGQKQGLLFRAEKGTAEVKFPGQAHWVPVEQKPYRIQIKKESRLVDDTYMNALLEAFESTTGMPLELSSFQEGKACDFLFDFSEREMNDTAAYRQAKHVFRYMPGKPEEQSDLMNKISYAGFRTSGALPALYKLIPAAADQSEVLWTDVYGRPVLTYKQTDKQGVFQFYSRFRPQWTDMVWSDALVNYLLPVLFPESILFPDGEIPNGNDADQRAYDGRLVLSPKVNHGDEAAALEQKPLSSMLTMLALLLFAIERVWTYKKRKEVAHEPSIG